MRIQRGGGRPSRVRRGDGWRKTMARLTCGPRSSAIGERGEGGIHAQLGQKVGWAHMPKGRRGASHGGWREWAYAVEPKEGAARARL